ncbi:MarR family winged helix-turn-helix transcriptional regulator [Methylocystis sp. JAN1]|uniref:MarR family winged helix-turn-helix transcriptional regulator n=1 Tax=Methylocystis sp. JAN1 TaxID=3397211 RepID=UPI003FA1D08A
MSELLQPKAAIRTPAVPDHPARTARRVEEDAEALDLVELFFFAYRDFVGDADRLLENYGFGRAHHRVLHFVHRRPGLPIAALLEILKITKQSLNRVLKQLLDGGFVEARAGAVDRRQRLLYPTPRGAQLARELAALQSERFRRVLDELPPAARDAAAEFLFAMVDAEDRERVRRHLGRERR